MKTSTLFEEYRLTFWWIAGYYCSSGTDGVTNRDKEFKKREERLYELERLIIKQLEARND